MLRKTEGEGVSASKGGENQTKKDRKRKDRKKQREKE